MTADDTSRDALIERAFNAWQNTSAAEMINTVVMPLIEERDQLRGVLEDLQPHILKDALHLAEQDRDTWHERWRQLMRDHEAVVKERDELEAENERLRDAARNYEIAMHGARGERDSAVAEVERLWVNLDEARGYTKKALAERDAAREQVCQRDEVIERVRVLLVEAWERIPGNSAPRWKETGNER